MLLTLFMIGFGVYALIKGEIKISADRKVDKTTGRILGGILLIGSTGLGYGFLAQVIALIIVIIVGLAKAK